MLSAICFNLDQSKILSFGNGLNPFWIEHSSDIKIFYITYPLFEVSSIVGKIPLLRMIFSDSGAEAGTEFSVFPSDIIIGDPLNYIK